jgi:DNA-binding NtrC family response regulator
MEELERRYLALALEKVRGNRQHAADLLGLSRRTVQRLIARYHLEASVDDETIESGADGARPDVDEEEEV